MESIWAVTRDRMRCDGRCGRHIADDKAAMVKREAVLIPRASASAIFRKISFSQNSVWRKSLTQLLLCSFMSDQVQLLLSMEYQILEVRESVVCLGVYVCTHYLN